jgi:hypothetical protein
LDFTRNRAAFAHRSLLITRRSGISLLAAAAFSAAQVDRK